MLRVYPLHTGVGYFVCSRVFLDSNESMSMISHMLPPLDMDTVSAVLRCCLVVTGASAVIGDVTTCAPVIGAAPFCVGALLVLI